jgi:hypothetical protein
VLCTASAASADVRLTMQDGRVSIVAKDATVRQILAEWARVGHTTIVNLDRIPGGPVTLELTDVTEAKALEVLLRSLSGYIAAPRATAVASLSHYDRIVVIPTLASERPAVAPAPPPQRAAAAAAVAAPQAEAFQPAPAVTPPVEAAQDTEAPPEQNVTLSNEMAVQPPARNATAYNPTFNRSNGAAEIARQGVIPGRDDRQPVTNSMPTVQSPFGAVSRPGMIVPAPSQPGQPGHPGQPGQPVRPGGQ